MSKKAFELVVGIVGGVSTIASAVVAFVGSAYAPAIIGAIGIADTAAIEIASLFVKAE